MMASDAKASGGAGAIITGRGDGPERGCKGWEERASKE
jgi:hypothetical protein